MSDQPFLWDHPVSPFAQKVRLAFREKGIPFQFATPEGLGFGNLSILDSKFSHANQRIEVPTLVDSGLKIFESTVILEYIEDKYPEYPLRPTDAAGRARARMIEDVCDSQYEAINWGMGEINTFQRAQGELASKMMKQAFHQIKQIQDWLTVQLGDAPWFHGEKLGWCDICVWPFVYRSTAYGFEPEIGSPLRKWYERIMERPSVRLVVEESEAGVKRLKGTVDLLNSGVFRREYRDHRLEWMLKSGGIDIVTAGLKHNNIRFLWPHPLQEDQSATKP